MLPLRGSQTLSGDGSMPRPSASPWRGEGLITSSTPASASSWWLLGFLFLIVTGCGAHCPRNSPFVEVAAWLELHALPQESVAVPERGAGCFGARAVLPLRPTTDALELLAALGAERPDYVVAATGVAWDGVRVQPWFSERYRGLAAWRSTAQPDEALWLFGYQPSPFDHGTRLPVELRFDSRSVALQAFRVSSPRVAPEQPLYVTLYWEGTPGYDVSGLRTRLELVEVATETIWVDSATRLATDRLAALPGEEGLATRYRLDPPVDLPQGAYRVTVRLEEPNGRHVPVIGQPETGLSLIVIERPPDVSPVPILMDHAAHTTFGAPGAAGAIVLSGYDAPDRVAPGELIRVALLWTATGPITESYSVFVHLLSADGTLVTQDDGVPVFGFYPTEGWAPGNYIRDQYALELPEEVNRGDYTLSVGLYLPASGDRLPVVDAKGRALSEDRVMLATVRVR
jgi:hypothetical protein